MTEPNPIFGRAPELSEIERFLASDLTGAEALRIDGEAGVGKTTLWAQTVRNAQAAGWRVLAASAAEQESRFAFAVLGDLLGHPLDETADRLQPALRRAIDTALLRTEIVEVHPDRRAVGLATMQTIRHLTDVGRVLLAVDDVQWLDAPSAQALMFAIRRLSGAPVGIVTTLRLGPGLRDRLDLDRSVPAEHLHRLHVGPLDQAAVQRIIRERTGGGISTTLVRRLHEASGGNAFYALELARVIAREGLEPAPHEPLPLPEDLEKLLRSRIRRLSPEARSVLLLGAVAGRPNVSLVRDVGGPSAAGALEEAAREEIIEILGERIRFTHPLLGSSVYREAEADERRSAHRRLSPVVEDPIERAWHLALATEDTDAGVAAVLDEAAEVAASRGAPAIAAELLELAGRLSPPEDVEAARERAKAAADRLFEAGDVAQATSRLEEVADRAPPGPIRAELFHRASRYVWNDIRSIRELLDRAFVEAGPEPPRWLQMRLNRAMGWVEMVGGDLRVGSDHHDVSVALAEASGEPDEIALSLAGAAYLDFMMGRPRAMTRIERAVESEAELSGMQLLTSPRRIFGALLMWSGDLDRARRELERDYRQTVERGHLSLLWEALVFLSELELRSGNWDLAAGYASEGLDIVNDVPQEEAREVHLWSNALVAAHRGATNQARAFATEGLALAERHEDRFQMLTNGSVLGFVELSVDNPAGAHDHLAPLVSLAERMGLAEPGIFPFLSDEIEALIMLGHLDEAQALLDRFEEQARARDRALALAGAARCQGLLAAARGDPAAGLEPMQAALGHHRRIAQPFDLARTQLVHGQILRRLKQKRSARDTLERALETFEHLGAPLWAEKARVELGRIGGRVSSPTELTPTERRVADLVGQGMTNRDVAAALFMSEHTVRANLKRIYPKLGIRSRTELASRLHGEEPPKIHP